jgi:TRAP-type C4-dicarboxylate transport system substrate-binding protein
LTDIVKFGTEGENFGSAVLTWAISENKWKTLPANVQKAMTDAGRKITLSACEKIDQDTAHDIEQWRSQGMSIVALPEVEREGLRAVFQRVSKEWAEGLDRRGKPGTETLNAFHAALGGKF